MKCLLHVRHSARLWGHKEQFTENTGFGGSWQRQTLEPGSLHVKLALGLTGCVTLGQFHPFSVPQPAYLQNGSNEQTYLNGLIYRGIRTVPGTEHTLLTGAVKIHGPAQSGSNLPFLTYLVISTIYPLTPTPPSCFK